MPLKSINKSECYSNKRIVPNSAMLQNRGLTNGCSLVSYSGHLFFWVRVLQGTQSVYSMPRSLNYSSPLFELISIGLELPTPIINWPRIPQHIFKKLVKSGIGLIRILQLIKFQRLNLQQMARYIYL